MCGIQACCHLLLHGDESLYELVELAKFMLDSQALQTIYTNDQTIGHTPLRGEVVIDMAGATASEEVGRINSCTRVNRPKCCWFSEFEFADKVILCQASMSRRSTLLEIRQVWHGVLDIFKVCKESGHSLISSVEKHLYKAQHSCTGFFFCGSRGETFS